MGDGGDTTPAPGVALASDGARFAVRSHHADRIDVCLFDDEDRETARVTLGARDGDLHHGFIAGVRAGQRYGLRAHGPWAPEAGHRFDPAKLLVDPYAARIDRPFRYDPRLGALGVDTAPLVPKAMIEDAVTASGARQSRGRDPALDCLAPLATTERLGPRFVYEVCVKAHTQLDPGVPVELRGTLAALAQPHVVARMAQLGVTHVELMPITAWIDERHLSPLGLTNAWGYNPVCFMAPDPRLAPHGIADLREAVAALRAAGIGVLLDVVFNHSGESDAHGPTLSLRGLDNAVYYRGDGRGGFVNDAGCGNILASDAPAVIELVLASLRHFATGAGVDGFRFDLATTLGRRRDGFDAHAPLLEAIRADATLGALTLIAEPWDCGPGGYQVGRFPPPWREWNDRFRDDVRRFWRGDAHAAGAFATRIAGSSDLFRTEGRAPSASVNFVAVHDGFSLRDLVSFTRKRNHANGEHNRDGSSGEICWNGGVDGESDDPAVRARRAADVRALLATLFVARGTPMLTAGDEHGRTQGGNNNAYAQDNETTWLDWREADGALASFVAGLARLRTKIPALDADAFLDGRPQDESPFPDAVWTRADGRPFADDDWARADFIGLTLDAPEGRAHLIFNRGEATDVVLPPPAPDRRWRLALDSARGFTGDEACDGPTLAVDARAVVALRES